MSRRLAIFCHYDKHNIIDDYVVLYIKALKCVTSDIQFISNSQLEHAELMKIKPYVQTITLRQNSGFDFGVWKETLNKIGLSYIITHYDELILANDSCYAPFSSFAPLFNRMLKERCDMWGITENKYPEHTFEDEKKSSITPHLQSYFLVFRKNIIQHACFSDFWQRLDNFASRDTVITQYEAGLTQLLQQNHFICIPAFPYQTNDLQNIKKFYGEPFYDLSIFYWHELLKRNNPLLKVKAIIGTLKWNKKLLKELERRSHDDNDLCSFHLIDKHLLRTSEEYRFSKIPVVKKIILLLQYGINRDPANIYAAFTLKAYKSRLQKKYIQGGITQIALAIYLSIKRKIIRLIFCS